MELLPPLVSVTLTVIAAAPNRFVAGRTVSTRLDPVPPNLIPDCGNSVVLVENAASMSAEGSSSRSPTVSGMAMTVSSMVIWLPGLWMVGKWLNGRTVSRNIDEEAFPFGSVAVSVMNVLPN